MPFDCFLKIEGIEGESQDAKHKNEIEVLSFHHGLSQAVTGTASSTGNISGQRVSIDSLTVTKALDKASPKLAGECAKGTTFPTVTLTLNRAGGNKEPYMQYKLSNAIISSVHVGGSSQGEGGVPTEEVGISFTKIEWKYTVISEKGTAGGNVSSGWDLAANKAV